MKEAEQIIPTFQRKRGLVNPEKSGLTGSTLSLPRCID